MFFCWLRALPEEGRNKGIERGALLGLVEDWKRGIGTRPPPPPIAPADGCVFDTLCLLMVLQGKFQIPQNCPGDIPAPNHPRAFWAETKFLAESAAGFGKPRETEARRIRVMPGDRGKPKETFGLLWANRISQSPGSDPEINGSPFEGQA